MLNDLGRAAGDLALGKRDTQDVAKEIRGKVDALQRPPALRAPATQRRRTRAESIATAGEEPTCGSLAVDVQVGRAAVVLQVDGIETRRAVLAA